MQGPAIQNMKNRIPRGAVFLMPSGANQPIERLARPKTAPNRQMTSRTHEAMATTAP